MEAEIYALVRFCSSTPEHVEAEVRRAEVYNALVDASYAVRDCPDPHLKAAIVAARAAASKDHADSQPSIDFVCSGFPVRLMLSFGTWNVYPVAAKGVKEKAVEEWAAAVECRLYGDFRDVDNSSARWPEMFMTTARRMESAK